MRSLTETEVELLLDPERVVAAIEDAFRHRFGSVVIPPRTFIDLGGRGTFLVMPCCDRNGRTLGMKLVLIPGTPGKTLQATYLLFDVETNQVRMLMPANYLTDLRTAATSAVATRYLARPDSRVLGIFGTGRQARAHLQVFTRLWNFDRVLVCGSSAASSSGFAGAMREELGVEVEVADARSCAAGSDVICTCTTSKQPLFDGTVLRPGTHLNLVGAFQPHAREVDTVTVRNARIVVDTREAALTEAGDVIVPLNEGAISREHVLAELSELARNILPVRQSIRDITLFKSVGCALEDLATAELLEQSSQDAVPQIERGPV
jgi:ornithine cyclodeaminase/alanine dehydrogenase-like protein (mu-crystallin family)